MQSPVVGDKGDVSRWGAGMGMFVFAILSFVGVIIWTMIELTAEFQRAPDLDPHHVTMHFIARAGIVAVVTTFSFGLIRAGERLTMPIARQIELAQLIRRGKTEDEGYIEALKLLRTAVKFGETNDRPPKDD